MFRSVSRIAPRAILISSLMIAGATGLQAQDKDGIYSQMYSLANQVETLRASGGDPTIVSPQVESLLHQYHELNNQLGGDDPYHMGIVVLPRDNGLVTVHSKVAPTAPAGSTATTANFANTDTTPITDNNTFTSDVAVTTGDTFLFDVDLTVNITHTFPGDLDITLTSPAGTVIPITTDNGGTSDDSFDGTVFDDQADDAATDFAYTTGVPAPTLVPEGAMAAFFGEDPNGTWTLSVGDDAGGDSGSLDGWSLDVTTLDAAPVNTAAGPFTNNTATPITDNNTFTSDVTVSGADVYLCDVNLTTDITHTFPGDLDITLTSPAGTVTTITTDNGGTSDDSFDGTVFDDQADEAATDFSYTTGVPAPTLIPEGALASFVGEDPNGTWTLSVGDDAGGDSGSLDSWSLDVTTCVGAGGGQPPFDAAIPTMGEWGLLALLLALASAGVLFIRRRF